MGYGKKGSCKAGFLWLFGKLHGGRVSLRLIHCLEDSLTGFLGLGHGIFRKGIINFRTKEKMFL
jgi:hypothetical protein